MFWPGSGADFDLRKAYKEFVRPTNGQCSFFLLSSLKMLPWFREFSLWATFVRGSKSVCEQQLYSFLPSFLVRFGGVGWHSGLEFRWYLMRENPVGITSPSANRRPSRFTTGTTVTHSHSRVANPFVARVRYRLSAVGFLSLCLLQLSCCNYLMWRKFLTCSSACLSWPNPT